MILRRAADVLTVVGLVVLVIALVTTTGSLAIVGALLVALSVVLAAARRYVSRAGSRGDAGPP